MDDEGTITKDENSSTKDSETVIAPIKDDVEKSEPELTDETSLKEDTKPTLIDLPTTCIPHQFIILPQSTGNNTHITVPFSLDGGQTSVADCSEPMSKLIRLEGEDGQTYVLAVSGDGSGELSMKAEVDITQAGGLHKRPATTSGSSKKSSSNDDFTQAWFTTRDDKATFQSKGHRWRQGQWTKEETELLQSNINAYCKENDILDPTEIIFEMSKDERKDFYRSIARGLQRPLFSVYRRVTRLYDQKNHMGKYTLEEMDKLRELRSKHGNDWAAIGAVLGRSASSVKDKCRLMKDSCNSGKWLTEEEQRLSGAVYELAGVQSGENITHGLSWAAVAERVGTRSEKQCRTKWLNYLNWKQQGGSEWLRQDDINLVLKIANLDVMEDTEIDWNELSQDWPSVRSPQWLRGKWWSLKRHVPDYQTLPFEEIINYLKNIPYYTSYQKARVLGSSVRGSTSDLDMQILPHGVSMETGEDVDGFQAYEVLHHLTPTSTGALLIAQSQNSPTISLSGAAMATDHIIVQTLPISQTEDSIEVNENVMVQLNNQPQVIITTSADESSLDGSGLGTSLHLNDGLENSDQELHSLGSHSDQLAVDSCGLLHEHRHEEIIEHFEPVSDSVLSADVDHPQTSGIVIGSSSPSPHFSQPNSNDGVLVMACSASPSHFSQSNSNDEVLVRASSTSPPHFSQSNSNDGELMSAFSDPILTSEGGDLMCSVSDSEMEKN
ncbi:cyclin-D-binding Myb-like transcription factor 1 isoform X2 [Gigantopelta aegis]|uniref:cyclin-D-binding Myb-like transcription factor 1 isoform X2 n=1 Tax=Gigantopelta aegis TaxID=1735272 RepID=UPI001B88C49C|nr:cyclin-D-binding Myb-like transcription factor 1 isoform X2 [Gigantopelta aegis]